MERYFAAAIQMDSTDDKAHNLQEAAHWIGEAASRGAKLIALPEQMNYIGKTPEENAEEIPGGETFCRMAQLARQYGVWLHCGSIFERAADGTRPCNTTMVIAPDGGLAAKYSKLHMFDVVIQDGPSIRESEHVRPGDKIVTVDAGDTGCLGLSICYDIRFGEIYRLMALAGAQVFVVPANFTMQTGKDHWEALLRARAIENGCYVIAPGQCGKKPRFQAYGKSIIVDPWGDVVAKASDKPGIIMAELDPDYLERVRRQVFTLENRRPDVYRLEET